MRFVIVTGVSGAGKTSALKMLEDAKYFCVDNLPIPLLEKFASLMPEIHGEDVQNVALGIDARSGRSLDELEIVLDRMKKAGYDFEILFLDAHSVSLFMAYGICSRGTKRNQRYFSKSPDLSDFVRTVNGDILAMLFQSTADWRYQ